MADLGRHGGHTGEISGFEGAIAGDAETALQIASYCNSWRYNEKSRGQKTSAFSVTRRRESFATVVSGGPKAAVLFTLLAGAKRPHLEPWAYWTGVLIPLAGATEDLDSLLPDRFAARRPEHVRSYRREDSRQKRAHQKAKRNARRRSGQ